MKFSIAQFSFLTNFRFATTAFGTIPGYKDSYTVEPFKNVSIIKDGYVSYGDCTEGKCLLDAKEWKGKNVLVGLRFTDELQTLNPDKPATDPSVFDIYSAVGKDNTKRAYNGINILAQNHVAKAENDELLAYLDSIPLFDQKYDFLSNSHVTLPFTAKPGLLLKLRESTRHKFAKVFINIKDDDKESDYLDRSSWEGIYEFEVLATQAIAEKLHDAVPGLEILIREERDAKLEFGFSNLPICEVN